MPLCMDVQAIDGGVSLDDGAQRPTRNALVIATAGATRTEARRRTVLRLAHWVCIVVVAVDQTSKALRPAGTFVVNSGGASIVPAALGNTLWGRPVIGALSDTIDAVLLITALAALRRLTGPSRRMAAALVVAGLTSNLIDRLGAASLFHPGLPRGSIDWIPVPGWTGVYANIADIAIAAGVVTFAADIVFRAARRVSVVARGRNVRLVAALVGVIVVASWTVFWQADRSAAQREAKARADRPVACAAAAFTGAGMDWLSRGRLAGPAPYDPSRRPRGCRTDH